MDKVIVKVCHICGLQIKSTTWNFKRHLKNKHNIVETPGYNIKCGEFSCKFKCAAIKYLRNHLECQHDIKQETEELFFKHMKEFLRWKEAEEIRTKCLWVKHRSVKDNTTYYFCNRSGKQLILPPEQRKRLLKSQGSCKINATCTSAITIKLITDNDLKVIYNRTHYGHTIKLTHVPLSISTKNAIATQLKQGIPATEILDKIRESVNNDFERMHFVTRKDIHNIANAFNVNEKCVKHANDAISVDLWVQEMSEDSNNCVILYKKQGVAAEESMGFLKQQDFLLAIMTSQCEILKKFGNNGIVCMDATHGTNPYNFNLVSMLIVDDYGEGFPTAFLISNREDYTALKYFITAVKEKAGNIKSSIFMSDDADQYFAAWSAVMDTSLTKKLLCTWHIDRAWRNKLSLIKSKEKQEQIYKTLCVLRQELDISNFNKYLNSFESLLESDVAFKEFKNYFKLYYLNRCTRWAACHRLGSGINTNMYLESMHKVLKYIYLMGIYCKCLDRTIYVLLKYVRDKQFQRLIKIDKGAITSKTNKINKSHRTAVNASDVFVIPNLAGWNVKSGVNEYTVTQTVEDSEHDCNLKCSICACCTHTYSCNCMDFLIHSNMCKHIHKVCLDNKDKQASLFTATMNEEAKENEINMHLHSLKKKNPGETQNKISENLNILCSTNWENISDQDTLCKINSCLSSAVNLISFIPSTTFSPVHSLHPANKKIDTQLRFQSTTKKNKAAGRIAKPSMKEIQTIKTALDESETNAYF